MAGKAETDLFLFQFKIGLPPDAFAQNAGCLFITVQIISPERFGFFDGLVLPATGYNPGKEPFFPL